MVGGTLGPDGLSKNWIVNFMADHIAGASYYATFFIRPTIVTTSSMKALSISASALAVGRVLLDRLDLIVAQHPYVGW